MPQPDHLISLDLAVPEAPAEADIKKYFDKCQERIGFIPNVIKGYAARPARWRAFVTMYHTVMDEKGSKLTPLEREMIAVVVSAVNRCYYCLVAHGQAVRKLSGDPELGEMLVMNYRVAALSERWRAMLDFASKLTETPWRVEEPDREALRAAGFTEEEIWDIGETAAFYNMSNRMASTTDMMPNREYHKLDR
jgi:uncharacterized peroxidase-related enzyme